MGKPDFGRGCKRMDEVGPVWLRCMARLQLAIAELECDKDADVAILFEQARQLLTGTCLERLGGAVDAVEAWMHLQRGDASAARSLVQRCVTSQDVLHGQFLLRLHPRLLTDVYAAALTLGVSEGEVRRAVREYGLRAPPWTSPAGHGRSKCGCWAASRCCVTATHSCFPARPRRRRSRC
jgi:hypothetical protein